MNSFTLKIIALITMLCDHIYCAVLLEPKYFFLNCIGRIAFPVFAFELSQGYIYTHNKRNYILRLLLFSIVSQIPFQLFLNSIPSSFALNVGFTLLLGFLAIFAYEKIAHSTILSKKVIYNKIIAFLVVFGIASLAGVLKTDYGMYGILLIFSFYIFRESKIYTTCSVVLLTLLHFSQYMLLPNLFFSQLILAICTCLSLCFIFLYNHKQGPKAKYLFYIFYPLHLLLLAFI